MFLNDEWTFLVELGNGYPFNDERNPCVCIIDLSADDERGDVEPYVDSDSGDLRCTLGADGFQREIKKVWRYREEWSFNDKFPTFDECSMRSFVETMLEANREFDDGFDDEEIERLKKHYFGGPNGSDQ